MKIALVTTSFLPVVGGAEHVVHHLANNWAAQGHEARVFNAFYEAATHEQAAYSVARYLIPRGATRFGYHRFPWHWIAHRSLKRALDGFKPEFISAHFGLPVALYLSAIKPGCPWSVTCHGNEISPLVFPGSDRARYDIDDLLGEAMNDATAVVALSRIAEESLLGMGVRASKIRRIPNGVDVAAFRREPETGRLRRLGLNDGRFLLSLGRNVPQKNLSYGLRVFAVIAGKHPDLRYLVCGHGCASLERQAREMGLAGRVVLSEPLQGDDLLAAYKSCLALMSTSVWEFSPLVILEAMAAGAPQIATDVPGTRDFVVNNETGFLIAPANHMDMAAAVERLIASPELRAGMKQKCLERSLEYDWPVIARKNLELCFAR